MNILTEVEKFKTAIRPFLDIWRSIDVRVICIRLFDKWINLGTTIILRSETSQEINSLEQLPNTGDLMALNIILDINEMNRVLENLSNGILVINNIEIYYGRKRDGKIQLCIHLHFNTQYREKRLWFPNFDFTTHVLLGTGDTINELIENKLRDLEWKLRAFDAPYDSLDDLAKTFLFHPLNGSRLSYVWVVAPLNARFSQECKICNSKLQIYLEAMGWPKREKVEVRIIQHSANGHISRSSYKWDNAKWTRKDKYYILRRQLDVKNSREVHLFMILRNVAIEKLTLYNPEIFLRNERVLIHDHFDKSLVTLKKYLNGEGKDKTHDFERGVGWLLHLCGFSIISYGFSRELQSEIDIIAFSPTNDYVICGECTIKRPDVKEKISKLSLRCKELETVLRSYNCRTLPLIFTPLDNDKIPTSEREKADKEGVIIVSQEKIQELIEMSTEPRSLSKVIDYLARLVPRSKPVVRN